MNRESNATRAIIYTRVSSARQAAEEKTSHATQERQCREACEERGYEVVGVYKEVIPRTELDRPALNEVRARVATGEAKVVMASVLDRLSGSQAHTYIIIEDVERHDGRVEFALEEYEDSAMGRFLRDVRAFMSAVELEKLSFRTKLGLHAKIQAGEYFGTLPHGYTKAEDGTIMVDPLTAPAIRRIYELYGNEGRSLGQVSRILGEEGYATPGRSAQWNRSTLHKVLAGRASGRYKGVWHGGMSEVVREKGKKKKIVPKPESEWGPMYEGPAIVTEELWAKANKRRLRAKAESPRRTKDPEAYLLRDGYIFCGLCGGKLYHRVTGDGRPMYHCGQPECIRPSITVKKIDPEVWAIVTRVLNDPHAMAEWSVQQAEDGTLDTRIVETRAEVTSVLKETDSLAERLAMPKLATSAAAKLNDRILALETRAELAQQELAELEAQAAQRAQLIALRDRLDSWKREAKDRLDSLTWAEQRQILIDIGVRVTIYDVNHSPRWTLQIRIDPRFGFPWEIDLDDPDDPDSWNPLSGSIWQAGPEASSNEEWDEGQGWDAENWEDDEGSADVHTSCHECSATVSKR